MIFDFLSVADYGGVPVVTGYIEESYRWIEEGLEPVHGAGITPIVLGGDHAQITAHLAANAAHEFLSLLALSKETVHLARGIAREPEAGILERISPTGRGGDDA